MSSKSKFLNKQELWEQRFKHCEYDFSQLNLLLHAVPLHILEFKWVEHLQDDDEFIDLLLGIPRLKDHPDISDFHLNRTITFIYDEHYERASPIISHIDNSGLLVLGMELMNSYHLSGNLQGNIVTQHHTELFAEVLKHITDHDVLLGLQEANTAFFTQQTKQGWKDTSEYSQIMTNIQSLLQQKTLQDTLQTEHDELVPKKKRKI